MDTSPVREVTVSFETALLRGSYDLEGLPSWRHRLPVRRATTLAYSEEPGGQKLAILPCTLC